MNECCLPERVAGASNHALKIQEMDSTEHSKFYFPERESCTILKVKFLV